MIKRQTFLRTAIASAAVVLGLAGCAMDPSSSVQVYTASLSAGEEVPPNPSTASGSAEVRVDTKTNEMNWKVSYSGLTGPATAGHIHGPAAKGANAGVVVPFPGVANNMSAEGKATITPAQLADLQGGRWYVNIHTARNPGGEIRGQLMKR